MFKSRTVIAVVAVFASCLVFAAAAFAAFETHHWAGGGYFLASGQNGFLNTNVFLNETWGTGENRAVCSGISGFGKTCVNRGETARYNTKGIEVEGDPDLHNHDTEDGYFNGWFWGEY